MLSFDQLLRELSSNAAKWDVESTWPQTSLHQLAEANILRWGIPEEYNGEHHSDFEFAQMYCDLSEACLLTTFILTQRNSAVQRIVDSENEKLKLEYLPQLSKGESFATVGISHLSTSRQHLKKPSVQAEQVDGGFRLSGFVPWITGGSEADLILTGGTLEDGQQILCLLDATDSSIHFNAPSKLMALTASHTGSLKLDGTFVGEDRIVAGPIENVMKSGGGGTGSTTTSALAIGVAQRSIKGLREEANNREDLEETTAPLEKELAALHEDLNEIYSSANEISNADSKSKVEALRKNANSLVLRASQAFLAATKGAGFVSGHPAERSVREAMFFLVWSCPQPVVSASLREFACLVDA